MDWSPVETHLCGLSRLTCQCANLLICRGETFPSEIYHPSNTLTPQWPLTLKERQTSDQKRAGQRWLKLYCDKEEKCLPWLQETRCEIRSSVKPNEWKSVCDYYRNMRWRLLTEGGRRKEGKREPVKPYSHSTEWTLLSVGLQIDTTPLLLL